LTRLTVDSVVLAGMTFDWSFAIQLSFGTQPHVSETLAPKTGSRLTFPGETRWPIRKRRRPIKSTHTLFAPRSRLEPLNSHSKSCEPPAPQAIELSPEPPNLTEHQKLQAKTSTARTSVLVMYNGLRHTQCCVGRKQSPAGRRLAADSHGLIAE